MRRDASFMAAMNPWSNWIAYETWPVLAIAGSGYTPLNQMLEDNLTTLSAIRPWHALPLRLQFQRKLVQLSLIEIEVPFEGDRELVVGLIGERRAYSAKLGFGPE